MMELNKVSNKELIDLAVTAMKVAEEAKTALEKYKAEIQSRGLAVLKDQNNRYCKMYGTDGSYAAVSEPQEIDILNRDRLKAAIGESVYQDRVSENTKTTFTLDKKLEKALKAIATNDYTYEYTLDAYLDQMSVPVSKGQKEVLKRRLKGDYKLDKKTLLTVLGYLSNDTTEEAAEAAAPNLDMDLFYISKIKNAELIQAFLPDEGIDWSVEEIKRALIVTSKLKLEISYNREDN
ncbi:hypothetical protein [Enterocloster lavalensis]|uniref:hypothetical protein n=1 Tax=Enterocloster lavalensis TaxID=460384 RepID=UPI001D08547D|nr:hypothetical protein [Enterocloster lavalensis]MCB6345400.1 hypothetical protein [Enterocloster lavalensis]